MVSPNDVIIPGLEPGDKTISTDNIINLIAELENISLTLNPTDSSNKNQVLEAIDSLQKLSVYEDISTLTNIVRLVRPQLAVTGGIETYRSGMVINFMVASNNTNGVQIILNKLEPKSLVNFDGKPLNSDTLKQNIVYSAMYKSGDDKWFLLDLNGSADLTEQVNVISENLNLLLTSIGSSEAVKNLGETLETLKSDLLRHNVLISNNRARLDALEGNGGVVPPELSSVDILINENSGKSIDITNYDAGKTYSITNDTQNVTANLVGDRVYITANYVNANVTEMIRVVSVDQNQMRSWTDVVISITNVDLVIDKTVTINAGNMTEFTDLVGSSIVNGELVATTDDGSGTTSVITATDPTMRIKGVTDIIIKQSYPNLVSANNVTSDSLVILGQELENTDTLIVGVVPFSIDGKITNVNQDSLGNLQSTTGSLVNSLAGRHLSFSKNGLVAIYGCNTICHLETPFDVNTINVNGVVTSPSVNYSDEVPLMTSFSGSGSLMYVVTKDSVTNRTYIYSVGLHINHNPETQIQDSIVREGFVDVVGSGVTAMSVIGTTLYAIYNGSTVGTRFIKAFDVTSGVAGISNNVLFGQEITTIVSDEVIGFDVDITTSQVYLMTSTTLLRASLTATGLDIVLGATDTVTIANEHDCFGLTYNDNRLLYPTIGDNVTKLSGDMNGDRQSVNIAQATGGVVPQVIYKKPNQYPLAVKFGTGSLNDLVVQSTSAMANGDFVVLERHFEDYESPVSSTELKFKVTFKNKDDMLTSLTAKLQKEN